jgi:hypothetical protein
MRKKQESKIHCTMDSTSLKQIPKFDQERKHFPVWLTNATAICALNGVCPALKSGFKYMLPANDGIPSDKKNSNEFQFIVKKNANAADWLDGLAWKLIRKLCAKFKPSDSKDEVIATVTAFKFNCNLCGKGRHKARDCPQCDKIKCKHCI